MLCAVQVKKIVGHSAPPEFIEQVRNLTVCILSYSDYNHGLLPESVNSEFVQCSSDQLAQNMQSGVCTCRIESSIFWTYLVFPCGKMFIYL